MHIVGVISSFSQSITLAFDPFIMLNIVVNFVTDLWLDLCLRP